MLMVVLWFAFPVLVATVFYPSEAVGFRYYLQGRNVPHAFAWGDVIIGEVTTLAALLFASWLLLVVTRRFYMRLGVRRSEELVMWPVAAVLVGLFGNLGWWFGTGALDLLGGLFGLGPIALLVIVAGMIDRMVKDEAQSEDEFVDGEWLHD
jgi:hypothetical protein